MHNQLPSPAIFILSFKENARSQTEPGYSLWGFWLGFFLSHIQRKLLNRRFCNSVACFDAQKNSRGWRAQITLLSAWKLQRVLSESATNAMRTMYQVLHLPFGMAGGLLLPLRQILLLKHTSQVEHCNILPQILQCQFRTYKCEQPAMNLLFLKREEVEVKSVSPLTKIMCWSSQELGITWRRLRRHFSSSTTEKKQFATLSEAVSPSRYLRLYSLGPSQWSQCTQILTLQLQHPQQDCCKSCFSSHLKEGTTRQNSSLIHFQKWFWSLTSEFTLPWNWPKTRVRSLAQNRFMDIMNLP